MAAKKQQSIDTASAPEVDMAHIKELMGPLPDENSPVLPSPKKTVKKPTPVEEARAEVVASEPSGIAAAAEEANESLMAMSGGLGEATITKIDDEPSGEDTISEDLLQDLAQRDEDGNVMPEAEVTKDDPVTVSAIDEIVAEESDTVLKAEDDERAERAGTKKSLQETSFREKLKNMWAIPYVKWGTIFGLLLIIVAAVVWPTSRYYVLNTAGVRSSTNMTIIDSSTLQPLKNVTVSIAGVNTLTNSSGVAKLDHLRLGPTDLVVSKRAFTPITQHLVLGWGSNPKGQLRLTASGAKYVFIATDFLSGKPIEKAEAVSGEGNAISDKDGRIVLSLDTSTKSDSDEILVSITAANYRTETVKIMANNKETSSVKMVSSRKSVFVSKRSGTYDIYSIDSDGKNEQKLVSGTGVEREDLSLAPQQNSDIAAYVATRENARNTDGYLLSTLYLLDTKTGSLTKADQSEQIQLIGWTADQRLVYIKIAAGASGANPKRQRLMSINAKSSSELKELASANYFNDAMMVGDKVLYAPSNAFQDAPKPGLFMVAADNTALQTVYNKEVMNIFRTEYDTISFDAGGSYFTYKVGAAPSTVTATTSQPNINRVYVDNVSGNRSLWFDTRDGKGVILNFDKTAKKDTQLVGQAGVKLPFYWLNDTTVVYRLNDGKEIADYVVSTAGGTPKKIVDVTDASGIGRWFYY